MNKIKWKMSCVVLTPISLDCCLRLSWIRAQTIDAAQTLLHFNQNLPTLPRYSLQIRYIHCMWNSRLEIITFLYHLVALTKQNAVALVEDTKVLSKNERTNVLTILRYILFVTSFSISMKLILIRVSDFFAVSRQCLYILT